MKRANKKLRILIADDHSLVRRGIRALLQDEPNWRVVGEAADGVEATNKARLLQPDIAIIDIAMPKTDGLAAIRQIRRESARTKVVIFTMHEAGQMVRRALEAGARGYVLKSDLADRLTLAIKEVTRGRLALGPRIFQMILEAFDRSREAVNNQDLLARLTKRESEIMRLVASGKADKVIAADLGITLRTAQTHRSRIMRKLELHSATELAHYAYGVGLHSSRGSRTFTEYGDVGNDS